MNPNLSASNVPRGFKFAATHCGLKKTRLDLGILVSDVPAAAAAVFTTNQVVAAPVVASREHLRKSRGLGARHHREFGQRELLHARRRLSGVDRDGAEACRRAGRRRSRADSRLLHRRDRRAAESGPNSRRGAGARPRAQLAGRHVQGFRERHHDHRHAPEMGGRKSSASAASKFAFSAARRVPA